MDNFHSNKNLPAVKCPDCDSKTSISNNCRVFYLVWSQWRFLVEAKTWTIKCVLPQCVAWFRMAPFSKWLLLQNGIFLGVLFVTANCFNSPIWQSFTLSLIANWRMCTARWIGNSLDDASTILSKLLLLSFVYSVCGPPMSASSSQYLWTFVWFFFFSKSKTLNQFDVIW